MEPSAPQAARSEADQPRDATLLLGRVAGGDASAADQLLPLVYDHLRAVAGSYFRGQRRDHTLEPTALVHEAYLKLVRASGQDWNNQAHFCAVASTAMRQILLNHAAAKRAAKRGGGDGHRADLDIDQVASPSGEGAIDVVALDEALTTLAELDERQARIVEMWFFGGLSMEQIAVVLGVSDRTVRRDWRASRAWLVAQLGGDG